MCEISRGVVFGRCFVFARGRHSGLLAVEVLSLEDALVSSGWTEEEEIGGRWVLSGSSSWKAFVSISLICIEATSGAIAC